MTLKRERFENINTIGLKRSKEMNQASHHLKRLASIPKNLSIPLSPHIPHQSKKGNLPKSLASSRVSKTNKGNNHHITNGPLLNPLHSRLQE